MEQIGNKRILFVLVLYKIRLEEATTFKTLFAGLPEEYGNIFVYDNSPYFQESQLPMGQYIHDTSNGGLGKAYNTAFQFAKIHHYGWLMLLDQDTTFPPESILKYRQAIESHSGMQMIVPVHRIQTGQFLSPTHYRFKTSHLQNEVKTGRVRFNDAAPINSGILVSTPSFSKAKGYDEAVWLDFSDIRFIEKYKRHYPSFYVIPDLVCHQDFSALMTDPRKRLKRHYIYLDCAVHYPKDSLWDALAIIYTTLRLTLSKTIRERTTKYIKAYWDVFISHKKISRS